MTSGPLESDIVFLAYSCVLVGIALGLLRLLYAVTKICPRVVSTCIFSMHNLIRLLQAMACHIKSYTPCPFPISFCYSAEQNPKAILDEQGRSKLKTQNSKPS